jgi:hypothetical protein
MNDKRYCLIKCDDGMWGIMDKELSDNDNAIITSSDKEDMIFIINRLNLCNELIIRLIKCIQERDSELNSFKNNVLKLIEDKIQELEDQYKFGQEVYKGCPMHNIRHTINTLKELQNEIK